MLFDSHCHLHFSQFNDDREKIIKKLRDFGVKIINVGTDLQDSQKALALAEEYPDLIWASAGIHPHDVAKDDGADFSDWNDFKKLAYDTKIIAIGECGLDYYRATSDMRHKTRERQKEIFVKQVELAKELGKPLIIHCRPTPGTADAYEDALDMLIACNMSRVASSGVVHFFSGSKEIAKKFLDLGFYISFAGPITFQPKAGQPLAGAGQYKELVEYVPIDRILAETDSPFAAPVPHRGKRNEPDFVEFVIRKIAEWKNLDFETAAERTAENAIKLFKINL
ncbi:TatD family hydrolase [Candidatus Azambacteria bacterium]|nr:TatD family hydrolase [Candidatus Azambacteria bacterium]